MAYFNLLTYIPFPSEVDVMNSPNSLFSLELQAIELEVTEICLKSVH